jgi:cardiolipin synthase (CMP-forming)
MNLPNLISLGRLVAVPAMVWLILGGRFEVAFWLFAVVGASDAIDGWLARRLGAVTELGKYLDPLADKMLLVAVFVALGYTRHVEDWLVILVVSRDVLIVGGVLLLYVLEQPVAVRPTYISKVNTFAQIVFAALVLFILGLKPAAAWWRDLVDGAAWAVAATTVISGAIYVFLGIGGMNGRARR